MHSMPALTQLEQGSLLLHRTLRRRHVTQLRGFKLESPVAVDAWAELASGDRCLLTRVGDVWNGEVVALFVAFALASGLLLLDMLIKPYSRFMTLISAFFIVALILPKPAFIRNQR